jgi:7-cyano-7-deazaguanine synthase in queuosine biosynthesis
MKIRIEIESPKKGKFSDIQLTYDDKETMKTVSLNIDFENIYKFTQQQKGLGFDLFLISCFIYGIDILVPRDKCSVNGWSRNIEVLIPVEFPDIFNKYKLDLNHLLLFLTGDNWDVSFDKREINLLFSPRPRMEYYSQSYKNSFKKINLFSGGMDSLIGLIDEISDTTDKIILASHYDSVFVGPKSDQNNIVGVLNKEFSNRYHLIQTRVDITNNNNNESTLRSRSFLFLCHAVFIAESMNKKIEIFIPENGTIALNHPLTPSRRSSCSTRTAHPYFLNKLSEYLTKIGIPHYIINKYEFKTKGEMVEECKNKELLLSTYKKSCSCAKRGRRNFWERRNGTTHCGICMPCIYRRVALNKIGIDDEILGVDIFNPQKKSLDSLPDIQGFLDYIETKLTLSAIERNLLVNGSLPLDKLTEYAKVIYRTREEIFAWISQSGSSEIKNRLGIK